MPADQNLDLEEERKKEILDLEEKLESNHFEFLGLQVGASAEEVKRAFHEASKRLHPDRYFGRNLGPFRARLERVFRRLIEAHSVLSDPDKKRAWLEANPAIRAAIRTHPGSASESPREKSEAERSRDAERQMRFAKHPYLAKATRMNELLRRAQEAMAAKEFSQAFTHLSNAAQLDHSNAEVKALLAEVRQQNEALRAAGSFKAGCEALDRGEAAAAIAAFKTAVSAKPLFHEAAHRLATLLLTTRADPKEVVNYAQKAVEGDPRNVAYRLFLGQSLEAAGMKALAKKHFEEAAKLSPDDPEVKKHVKKRWPF